MAASSTLFYRETPTTPHVCLCVRVGCCSALDASATSLPSTEYIRTGGAAVVRLAAAGAQLGVGVHLRPIRCSVLVHCSLKFCISRATTVVLPLTTQEKKQPMGVSADGLFLIVRVTHSRCRTRNAHTHTHTPLPTNVHERSNSTPPPPPSPPSQARARAHCSGNWPLNVKSIGSLSFLHSVFFHSSAFVSFMHARVQWSCPVDINLCDRIIPS